MQSLFGKAPTIEEQVRKTPNSPQTKVRKWKQNLRTEDRALERQIRNIEMEERKIKAEMKTAVKRPQSQGILRTLAKELVNSRKVKDRLHTSRAQLNSVAMQLQEQAASMKMAGTLKKSTVIMQMVNRLVKLPEIQKTMMEMSKEMMKAGLIEEIMQDTLEVEDEELETEAEEEVEKVLMEITGDMASVPIKKATEKPVETAEDEDLKNRLQALRS